MSEKELLPPDEPRWTVATRYRYQTKQEREAKIPQEVTHHELLYGNSVQTKRKGEHGLEQLREMAKFLNKKRLLPRDRVECAADSPNPANYIAKAAYRMKCVPHPIAIRRPR